MASEHSSSGPAFHEMTPTTISSGLVDPRRYQDKHKRKDKTNELSGYKASGEPITVLQQHRQPPQAKASKISMANEDDQPTGQDDLATKVEKLTKQLESIICWIQA
ncbi:hypothetical protein Tco_1348128 [Tanacetum coccineum]